MSAILVVFVIPSEVEESRCATFAISSRDVWTSLDMTEQQLLPRISRHYVDALDHHAFGRFARFTHAVPGHRSVTDFLEHVLAFNQFAKGRVLMIKPVHRAEADEELRTGRVRIRPARHRNHAAVVAMIVELGLEVVPGSALPVAVLFCRIFRIRIAALAHEFFYDPVENRPVVKALARQFLEILDRVWCG